MHPELLNNSLFLRYYNQWQQDPASIVFVPVAEYFLSYGLTEEALRVLQAGLTHHPELISARLCLAKVYVRMKEFSRAKAELKRVLAIVPHQEKALELDALIEKSSEPAPTGPITPEPKTSNWQTLTMAKIYEAQGHHEQAREVYQSILERDPQNEEAKQGLAQLEGEG